MSASYQRAWVLYYELKRYDMAERELRGVLVNRPDDPYAHALLSLTLTQRRQFTEAANEVGEALRIAPNLAFVHYVRARLLGARNKLSAAQTAIKEAIRLDPTQADYFSWLAAYSYDTRQWRAALSAAEQGLTLDPLSVSCANLRALALAKLGRGKEARATSLAALARDPENAVTHAIQGTTLLRQAEYGEALVHFCEARRLDPLSEWAHRGHRSARAGYSSVWPAQTLGHALLSLARRRRGIEHERPDLFAGWLGAIVWLGALILALGPLWRRETLSAFYFLVSVSSMLSLWLGQHSPGQLGDVFRLVSRILTILLGFCLLALVPDVLVHLTGSPPAPALGLRKLAAFVAGLALVAFLFGLGRSGTLADASLPRRK